MKKACIVCLLLFLLCACAFEAQPAEVTSVSSDPAEEFSQAPVTEISTEIPTEAVTVPPYIFPMEPGSYLETYQDEETQDYLDYYLFIPEGASDKMPLVIFLHGDGEVGNPLLLEDFGLIKAAREIYGEKFPFIAISPCTRVESWISGSIPQTLIGLIDDISERLSINTDRIIITGHSRGAIGVWHMISTYGDFFSAAVPVSCGAETALDMENCVQVPVLAHAGNIGKNENIYREQMFNIVHIIKEYGGNAEMIVLENKNHTQTSTCAFTEDVLLWMLEQ